jgi:hypothetical protein
MAQTPTLALVAEADPRGPLPWWLIRGRIDDVTFPIRHAIFRRHYELAELRTDLLEQQDLTNRLLAVTEKAVDLLMEQQEASHVE